MKLDDDMRKNFEHGERYVLDPFGLTRFTCGSYNPLSEINIHDKDGRETVGDVRGALLLPMGDEDKLAEEGAFPPVNPGRNGLPPRIVG